MYQEERETILSVSKAYLSGSCVTSMASWIVGQGVVIGDSGPHVRWCGVVKVVIPELISLAQLHGFIP
jgi:hypothetical protein